MRSPSVFSECSVSPSFLRTTPARKPRTECACQPVASMMAVMVAPFGRLNSASTTACLDLPVLEWTTRFGFFAFHRLFAPDRGFALGRPLVLVISDPLWVSAHQRAAPPQPRGGRPALAGERTLEAISIGLHWPPLTLCLPGMSRGKSAILLLICPQRDPSWIVRSSPPVLNPDAQEFGCSQRFEKPLQHVRPPTAQRRYRLPGRRARRLTSRSAV